jgi:glycine/D-amino acid oxidase-like deaminating enzyme/nitrite reductase/ring-hydroxylating ferredoxin subunit
MRGSGTTTSVWMETSDWPATYRADIANHTDILVIGAGIAGLTTAYLLQREGRRVTVLDDGPIGSGETGRTTAHLSNAIDDRFTEIERVYGQQGSRQAAESHGAAIDRIEAIVRDENIDCDFKRLDGYLILAEGCPAYLIDDELQAAHRAGLGEVVRVEQSPAPGFAGQPALRFPRQGRFHALKYLLGLAQAFERQGGRIATGVHVSTVDAGQPATVHLGDGRKIAADIVVCCTNSPVIDQYAIHTKQAPYRTYAVGLKVSKGAVADALYWDTLDIYHYVRVQEEGDHDVLIVGGEDHKTGEATDMDQRYRRLEDWTRQHFPQCGETLYRWSGQVMEPFDGLAFIGRDPGNSPNILVATGDSGMGMTHGTIAGILLTDLIQGRNNEWAGLYDPTRKQTSTLGAWLRENLDVAKQMTDYIKPGDVAVTQEIPAGHGAVIREGLSRVAVYRDDQGMVHRMSAVCPHLKCVVHWNPGEKSWDCPCHGSRFSAYGEVLNGPAASNLTRLT